MIPFTKMQGIGNDYVYVDGFHHRVDEPEALARAIADRHYGVGGDGLILILPPSDGVDAHVRMRMFNADGSESEMCGNGVRCVCKYAHDHGLSTQRPMLVETGAGVLSLDYELGGDGLVARVTVDMGPPVLETARIPVRWPAEPAPPRVIDEPVAQLLDLDLAGLGGGLDERLTCVSMGNPHAVLFCENAAAVPLEVLGPHVEHDRMFPNRVNLHVVQVHDRGELTMRTWERGSGITLACGTGAAAVCVASALTGRAEPRVLIHLPGGDLELAWDRDGGGHVFKTGPAVEVFSGEWTTAWR